MKPIRLNTIGKIVWFFLILAIVLLIFFIISLFQKEKPKSVDPEPIDKSEKIIDYTASKNYTYDFSKDVENDILIEESGSYKLVGNDETYRVVIDSKSAVVKIILSNFNTNITKKLIDVKNVHKLIIEVEDGTENSILKKEQDESEITYELAEDQIIIDCKSDLEFIGTGILKIDTDGDFVRAKNVIFKNLTLELENVKNGFELEGDLTMESGNLYIKSYEDAINSKGNIKIQDGLLVLRGKNAIMNEGLFMTNKGKIFIASSNEIKKPNADSMQKSLILNFKEPTKKMLLINDNHAFILAYEGGIEYQHVLYSDEFKEKSYIIYEDGKISGTEKYGLYKIDEAESGKELTSASLNNFFEVNDIVNVYEEVVKK